MEEEPVLRKVLPAFWNIDDAIDADKHRPGVSKGDSATDYQKTE